MIDHMASWDDVVRIGLALPEVVVDDWYGTPALKVRTKGFARMWSDREHSRDGVDRATPVLVVMCDVEEKDALMASHHALFETPHYKGHGAMLIRLDQVDDDDLAGFLEDAWCQKAPKTLIEQLET
mgnify:CR=1 FL=1